MKRLMGIIISILISLYLTTFIKYKISLDMAQYIFIFMYFIIICIIPQLLMVKRENINFTKKQILILSFISIIILSLGKDFMILKQYEDGHVIITATGQKNVLSNSYEVWITSLEINGVPLNLEEIELERGWYLQDGFIVANYGENSTSLNINVKQMKSVKIGIFHHTWSGIVEIYQNEEINQIDLYSDVGKIQEIEINGVGQKTNLLYLFGCFFSVLYSMLFLIYIFRNNYFSIDRIIFNEVLFLLMIYNGLYSFFDRFSIIIIIISIVIVNYFYGRIKRNLIMQSYFTIKSKILISLCNVYITFSWIGHYLFINTNKVTIDINKLVIFITGMIILYPLLYCFIYSVKKLTHICFKQEENNKKKIRKVRVYSFFIMFIPLIIISLGYYPGAMTPDGVDQCMQALGIFNIYDAHPAIHTLFLRLCLSIVNTPYTIVVVQIVIFVTLWVLLFGFLYEKGFSSMVIYIVAFMLSIMPNNYMMLSLISKNILYALIILWNMYLLIKLLDDGIKFFSFIQIVKFSIALALLNTVRHNGFLGTYAIWIFLIVWGLYTRKFKSILIVALSWLIVIGIRGPLYNYFDVQNIKNIPVVKEPLLAPAGMYILAEEEIPSEGVKIVYRIGSIEEWKENYNPYNGDILGWGKLRNNILECSQEDAFHLYFTLLKDNPLLVIKDRLHAIDILWNVIEPKKSYNMYGAYNVRYTTGIWLPSEDWENMPDFLLDEKIRRENKKRFNNLGKVGIEFSTKYQLLDALFWRNGVYFILGILLVLINYIEKRGKSNIVMLPAFATLCSLALAASWQMYQYYWFFSLSIIYFGLYTLSVNKNVRHK